MIQCSCKYVNVIFNILKSKGPVLVYTNFVVMEGIEVFKLYLSYFQFNSFLDDDSKDFFRYGEYHNNVKTADRLKAIKEEEKNENVDGSLIKIMIFSPAGSEGVSLEHIRQVHIVEPYWHEVRIFQMIGRAIRQCSHKLLPMSERHVDIYRYKSIKHNVKIVETIENQVSIKKKIIIEDVKLLQTIDSVIERVAISKDKLINTFLTPIKEVAIDCKLFENHNMATEKYKCFQFDEKSMFDKNIGPAYKQHIEEDIKNSNGSNSFNSITKKIKILKINGIIKNNDYNNINSDSDGDNDNKKKDNDKKNKDKDKDKEKIQPFWCNFETEVGASTVYDYDLQFPIGKLLYDENDIPLKYDRNTYYIDVIQIPSIL